MLAALEKKYDLIQQEAIQKDKSKTSMVDNLLQGIASPFTEDIAAKPLPDKFKCPTSHSSQAQKIQPTTWTSIKPIWISMALLKK
jgi:hypothetical protein